MSQPCLVAAAQCAAMQEGLAQSWYCEHGCCRSSTIRDHRERELKSCKQCCSQHTHHESPLEGKDSMETTETMSMLIWLACPDSQHPTRVLLIPQPLKDPENTKNELKTELIFGRKEEFSLQIWVLSYILRFLVVQLEARTGTHHHSALYAKHSWY